MSNGNYRRPGQGGGNGGGKRGMSLANARNIAAQVANWAMLAAGVGDGKVPSAPNYTLNSLLWAHKTLVQAGERPGFGETTICALVLLRDSKKPCTIHSRGANGNARTLTLGGAAQ